MRTTEHTIYLSDYFTVPMPFPAATRQKYLRKIRKRRILWALLPYLLKGIGILALLWATMAGFTICAIGLGA